MASLFSRRGTPFILDGDKPGKILDLRIHWTAAEKMVSAPTGIDLDPGESNLASVTHAEGSSIFSLVFYGRHPLLEDVYFTTTVDLDTTIPADYIPYITESGSYQVQTAGGSYILYTVLGSDVSENADISMCVQNPRVVILVDLTDNASSWVSEDSDTGTVEPFNVIFDYLRTNDKKMALFLTIILALLQAFPFGKALGADLCLVVCDAVASHSGAFLLRYRRGCGTFGFVVLLLHSAGCNSERTPDIDRRVRPA